MGAAGSRCGVRMGHMEGRSVNPTPPITDDDIRRAMCCPDGCREPSDCARHAYAYRQGAAAVMKMLQPRQDATP